MVGGILWVYQAKTLVLKSDEDSDLEQTLSILILNVHKLTYEQYISNNDISSTPDSIRTLLELSQVILFILSLNNDNSRLFTEAGRSITSQNSNWFFVGFYHFYQLHNFRFWHRIEFI